MAVAILGLRTNQDVTVGYVGAWPTVLFPVTAVAYLAVVSVRHGGAKARVYFVYFRA